MHRKIVFLAGTFICGLALTLALMLLLTTTTKPVFADPGELYVAPGGNCGGVSPCYENVQAAVDAATPGDTIKVAAGTYTDTSLRPRNDVTTTGVVTQVVYITKTVIVRGGYTTTDWETSDPDANPTTLDAQGQGRVLYITGDITPTIEGLLITGGDASGLGGHPTTGTDAGGGVYIITATAAINNGQVFDNAADFGGGLLLYHSDTTLNCSTVASNTAMWDGGGLYMLKSDAVLNANIIISNTAYNGGGLWMATCDATLTNNVIADNKATNNKGGGIFIYGSSPQLLHTTIARNSGEGVLVILGSDAFLVNTIFASNNSIGIDVGGGNTATLNSVLWYGNITNTAGSGVINVTNAITGDPAFASDGYHITPASAALDTGVNAGVTTDIDGHHRPYNSTPDLGADELIATTVPTDVESTLTYTDTQGLATTVQVPSGAVTEEITLVYTPVETSTAPSDFVFAGHTFDLDAYQSGSLLPGFTFSVPVTITLHYADADVVGLDEDSLVLDYWNGSAWVDAACGAYDRHPDENWLAAPICHLSQFALFGEREYLIYLPLVLRNYQ